MNEKTTPILVVLLIVASFAIGSMWTKIQYLQTSPTVQPNPSPTAGQPTQPTAPSVSLDKIKAQFADGFIHFGDANRKVLFTEISDPSCPFCHFAAGGNPELVDETIKQNPKMIRFKPLSVGGTYNPPVPEMKKLVDAGKASFVWIYANGHDNGELGTQAFYCAFEKNKFWEVHDLLMSNKGYEAMNTTKVDAAGMAALLAPVVDIKDCLTSGKYAKNLTRDQGIAQTLGFQGTPHFLINTTPFGGAQDWKSGMEPLVKTLL
jgi:protein-disulfide isomerase